MKKNNFYQAECLGENCPIELKYQNSKVTIIDNDLTNHYHSHKDISATILKNTRDLNINSNVIRHKVRNKKNGFFKKDYKFNSNLSKEAFTENVCEQGRNFNMNSNFIKSYQSPRKNRDNLTNDLCSFNNNNKYIINIGKIKEKSKSDAEFKKKLEQKKAHDVISKSNSNSSKNSTSSSDKQDAPNSEYVYEKDYDKLLVLSDDSESLDHFWNEEKRKNYTTTNKPVKLEKEYNKNLKEILKDKSNDETNNKLFNSNRSKNVFQRRNESEDEKLKNKNFKKHKQKYEIYSTLNKENNLLSNTSDNLEIIRLKNLNTNDTSSLKRSDNSNLHDMACHSNYNSVSFQKN